MTTDVKNILSKKVSEGQNYVDITIVVKPQSNSTKLVIEGEDLVFYTVEPAEKGRANASLIRFLSRTLKLPLSKIDIVYGIRDTTKRIRVYDITLDELLDKISKAVELAKS